MTEILTPPALTGEALELYNFTHAQLRIVHADLVDLRADIANGNNALKAAAQHAALQQRFLTTDQGQHCKSKDRSRATNILH